MKKVLIVADTYYPKMDGIVRFLDEIVPRIMTDLDITLLVPDFGMSEIAKSKAISEHAQKHDISSGISVFDIAKFKEIRLKTSKIVKLSGYPSIRLFSNLSKIREAVKNSDLVFIQGPALASVLALYYSKKFRKTVIHYMHTILWELYDKNLPKLIQKLLLPTIKKIVIRMYNLCDVLVLPYRSLKQYLEDLNIIPKKEIVRLGVDSNLFCPAYKDDAKVKLGIDKSYTVVGYVGRISKEKNVATLIEAMKRLYEKHKLLLLIVGNGTGRMMQSVNEAKNTLHPGFQKNVVPYYQAMDIFVMPSLTETTSLATLEAMSCGIPVITTKVGFLKEYVKKDYNGLLFPKGNVYTLVLQLEKMIRHRKLREQMGINARQTALNFSWDRTAKKISEILMKY